MCATPFLVFAQSFSNNHALLDNNVHTVGTWPYNNTSDPRSDRVMRQSTKSVYLPGT